MHNEYSAFKDTEQLNPHPLANRPTPGLRVSLRSLMIGVLVICAVFAILLPVIRFVREGDWTGLRTPFSWPRSTTIECTGWNHETFTSIT